MYIQLKDCDESRDFLRQIEESDENTQYSQRELRVSVAGMSAYGVQQVLPLVEHPPHVRCLTALLAAHEGRADVVVPTFDIAPAMFTAYFRAVLRRGWLFDSSGSVLGLVVGVSPVRSVSRDKTDERYFSVAWTILDAYAKRRDRRYNEHDGSTTSRDFVPGDVTRKTLATILLRAGIRIGTEDLFAAYDNEKRHFDEIVVAGFRKQYLVETRVSDTRVVRRRAIHIGATPVTTREHNVMESLALAATLPIPETLTVPVFDLEVQKNRTVRGASMTQYVYRPELSDRLILPVGHREMLDVLTSDISDFRDDFTVGKSGGNLILCKGPPGVGKTLTAEIYSEIMGVPLYSVRTGVLGSTAETISRGLEEVLDRQAEWGCVLLLDEADVFVARRRDSLQQNAVVAEFLRQLERFNGTMFLTTNRLDDIDEAIESRCAAIITYEKPTPVLLREVWREFFDHHGFPPRNENVIDALVAAFPDISPRDVKLLLRLALRVCVQTDAALTLATLRKCAAVRNVEIATPVDGDVEYPDLTVAKLSERRA